MKVASKKKANQFSLIRMAGTRKIKRSNMKNMNEITEETEDIAIINDDNLFEDINNLNDSPLGTMGNNEPLLENKKRLF